MSTPLEKRKFTLWSWSASDCSARLRIALALKQIPYELEDVDLGQGERTEDSVNPNKTVPTLLISSLGDREDVQLTQSVAALEYLEEAFPESTPLLPPTSQTEVRAAVRTLVQVIATDIHPLTTPRAAEAVRALSTKNGSAEVEVNPVVQWDHSWMRRGLSVYEKLVKITMGTYSVGDNVTMADVCLWPEVSTARKMGLNMDEFPLISGIIDRLNNVAAFRDDAHVSARLK